MAGFVLKPSVRLHPSTGMFTADEYAAVQRFYQSQPPTPLHTIGNLIVKDESQRLGLNAFKILGVRYAIERLRQQDRIPNDATLACATDGNHGRAVARTAARLGYLSHIYLPKHASPKRIRSIQDEGAEVHIVDGNYDDAVRQSALEAQRNNWVIVSDTSWPGYEEIPRDIMCGYTQILNEAATQWSAPPDIVFVQAAVGGLATAIASWFAFRYAQYRPFLILCQPAQSPCILEAARRNHPTPLTGSLETIMDCLSAGEVSHTAWPVLASLYDAYMSVDEPMAAKAVEVLGQHGIDSGYSGACGVAALLQLQTDPALAALKEFASLTPDSTVMTIVTEGMLISL